MRNYIVYVGFLFIVVFSSCRKLIQDEFPDFSDKPTVNCILMEGMPIKVYLSLAQKIGAQAVRVLDNASVYLYQDSILLEELSYTDKGMYGSTIVPECGKTYGFRIDIPSFPSIEKQILLPLPEKILSIEHFKSGGVDQDGQVIPAVRITFTNNPRQKQYYRIFLKYFPYFNIGDLRPYYANPLNLKDPVLLNENLPSLVFSNEKIQGDTYSLFIEYSTGSTSNGSMSLYPLVAELRTIDEAHYQYLKSLYLYERGRFDSYLGEVYPIYPVYSNVPNGYGLMSAFSIHVSDTVKP